MPDTTPTYGLPYPNSTDTLQDAVQDIPQSLAEQIEATLAAWGGVVSPSAWTAMPYAASWAQPAGFTGMRGYSKIGTRVYVDTYAQRSGSASVAGATLATLPAGFTPPGSVIRPSIRSDTGAGVFVTVTSAGAVSINVSIPAGVSVPLAFDFGL